MSGTKAKSIGESGMRQFDVLTREDFVRMDEASNGGRDGLRMIFSPEIEDQILTPHQRERGRTEPVLWLLWKMGEDEDYTHIPQLECICTNEYSIRYHVGALLAQQDMERVRPNTEHGIMRQRMAFHVERTLADHAFGSSLLIDAQSKMIFTKPIVVGDSPRYWGGYRREGD